MISIRNLMRDGDRSDSLAQALLKAYLELIGNLPEASLPADPGLFESSSQRLAQTAKSLSESPSGKKVGEQCKIPLEELDKICRSNKAALEDGSSALKEVLATAAEAINSLRGRGQKHNVSLVRMADEFEALSRIDDIGELRRRLKDDVSRLRTSVDEMRKDNDDSLEEFNVQIVGYQRRLDDARRESNLDRLTGLNNRRELERQVKDRLAANRPFSLMLFDLDHFGAVNERFGNPAGDNLLKHFADILRRHVATDTTIFRWGADEFAILVITEDVLPELARRAGEIAAAYRVGEYFVVRDGKQVAIQKSVSCGAAQSIRGDGLEVVYQRARELLEVERAKRY